MSPLIGRDAELTALRALWNDGVRLVTVTGPFGVGKSALARAFVNTIPNARHIDLVGTQTERDVLATVARALGTPNADEAWVIETLSAEPSLLVFDPAERVLEPVRELLVRWLLEVPTLRAMCVSREALLHEEERILSVSPLKDVDADALFVQTAKLVQPAPEELVLVRRITERLAGLPLAIVLAARRTDLLSLRELHARLNSPLSVLKGDGDEGTHASLRAAIRWSWEGLQENERTFLVHVSPASFGFRFDVAEALTKDTEATLDALDALTKKHLVFATGSADARRFHVMSAVRDFAHEQMAEKERREAREAFALAVLHANEQKGDDPHERDTLHALASGWLEHEPELAARALLAAHRAALLRGPFDVHTTLLAGALERVSSPTLAAQLERALGELRRERGDLKGAKEVFRSARARNDSQTGWADATRLLGVIARMEGETTLARDLIEQALDAYKTSKDERGQALAFGDLGTIQLALGQLQEARESLRRVTEIHRRRGDRMALGPALSYLGIATHRLGHFEEALAFHEEARTLHEQLGRVRYLAAEATHLGYCHHELGNNDRAKSHFADAIRHAEAAHDLLVFSIALLYSARIDLEGATFDAAEEKLHRALAATQEMSHARLEASVLTAMGHLALARDDFSSARTHYERALARSTASEVGFELLTHGYLALVLGKLGNKEAASEALLQCLRATRDHENPLVQEAARFLEKAVRGEDISKNRAASSEARWIQRLDRTSAPGASLAISEDGEEILLLGQRIDMKRRGALRRILVALVAHRKSQRATALDWQDLAEAGWPGEKMRTEAAIKRVYTAVWTLRKMGLGEHLVTRDDGYFLSEALAITPLDL